MEERKELILIDGEHSNRPKRQWKKQIQPSNYEEYEIKEYLIKILDEFYISYLDYVCNVAKDKEYEIKNFINGSKVWSDYRRNLFYPIYKYIKQYYKIEEPFISYTEIIEMVERFFKENNFQGLKFSFEDFENRDSNIDYQLRNMKNVDELYNTVVIEFLFGEEAHNFKLRTRNYCSIDKMDMPLRVELLIDNPLLIFKNISGHHLNSLIDHFKNVGYGGGTQITIYVKQSIDKILGLNFFNKVMRDKSSQSEINYYLENYPTIEIRNKKVIEEEEVFPEHRPNKKKGLLASIISHITKHI